MLNQNLNIDPSDVAIQDCDLCNGGGIIFHAISNEDFDVEMESFRSAAYMAAARKKVHVKTHIPKKKDCIFIQKKK